jgi:hypothetical protein
MSLGSPSWISVLDPQLRSGEKQSPISHWARLCKRRDTSGSVEEGKPTFSESAYGIVPFSLECSAVSPPHITSPLLTPPTTILPQSSNFKMLHFPSLRVLYYAMLIFEAATWVLGTIVGLRRVELVAEVFSKGAVWRARKGEKEKSESCTEKVKDVEEMKEKEAASSTEVRLPESRYDSAWYRRQ